MRSPLWANGLQVYQQGFLPWRVPAWLFPAPTITPNPTQRNRWRCGEASGKKGTRSSQRVSPNGNCCQSTKNEPHFWEIWHHATAPCSWIVSGRLMLAPSTSGLKCPNTRASPTEKTQYPLMLYVSIIEIISLIFKAMHYFIHCTVSHVGIIFPLFRRSTTSISVCGNEWQSKSLLLCVSHLPN